MQSVFRRVSVKENLLLTLDNSPPEDKGSRQEASTKLFGLMFVNKFPAN